MLIVRCDGCGQDYALPEQAAGTTKECRKCHQAIEIPPRDFDSPGRAQPFVLSNSSLPPRDRRVLWMTVGAALMAIVMTTIQWVWQRTATESSPQQPYRPMPIAGDAQLNAAQRMYNKSISSIVYVYTFRKGGRGHGSGFVLGDGIVTNYHVVRDAEYVIIETYWRQRFRVDRCVTVDRYRDLAVLPVPASIASDSLKLAERAHAVGEQVYTMGSPRDVRFGISEGVIVAMGKLRGASRGFLVQCDISGAPGASGSPLLDADGHVLGVISLGSTDDRTYTFAVHSEELRNLLLREKTPYQLGAQ